MAMSTIQIPVLDSLDQVERWAMGEVLSSGSSASPRGLNTLESLNASFVLTRPRSRRIVQPERRWSFRLAVAEFLWHASASDDVRFISHYSPRWAHFAKDGRIVGSSYGHTIFAASDGKESQWTRVERLLRTDPDTRRAVLDFRAGADRLDLDAKDVACASSLQFLIRKQKLHAVVTMRSNDIVWGLPYDVFVFTMFQEMMAQRLGLELGSYYHCAASLHLYERHFSLARAVCHAAAPPHVEMPPMGPLTDLPFVLDAEQCLRLEKPIAPVDLSPYWEALLSALSGNSAAKVHAIA